GSGSNSGIQIENASLISTTGAGRIALYGSASGGTTQSNGVSITGLSLVSTDSGELRIYGVGDNGSCPGGTPDCGEGIQIGSGAMVTSIDGKILLRGANLGTSSF